MEDGKIQEKEDLMKGLLVHNVELNRSKGLVTAFKMPAFVCSSIKTCAKCDDIAAKLRLFYARTVSRSY